MERSLSLTQPNPPLKHTLGPTEPQAVCALLVHGGVGSWGTRFGSFFLSGQSPPNRVKRLSSGSKECQFPREVVEMMGVG